MKEQLGFRELGQSFISQWVSTHLTVRGSYSLTPSDQQHWRIIPSRKRNKRSSLERLQFVIQKRAGIHIPPCYRLVGGGAGIRGHGGHDFTTTNGGLHFPSINIVRGGKMNTLDPAAKDMGSRLFFILEGVQHSFKLDNWAVLRMKTAGCCRLIWSALWVLVNPSLVNI